MESKSRSKSVDAILNRVEVSRASRQLQTRLRLASYKARNGIVNTPIDSILRTSAMPPPRSTTPGIRYNQSIGHQLFKSPVARNSGTRTRTSISNHASPGLMQDSESMNAANALTSLFHSPGYKPQPTHSTHTAPTPTQQHPDEADAQLMLFLATSPSPAKPDRYKQPRQSTASPRYSNLDFTQWIHSPQTQSHSRH
ncbi:hypothetical protein E3P99_01154 [Wallemia hederae]|uniref:Uncharacterized protein n=1 Tax=Wallemia hederae TaxID=1540922 RepID=A0A4T0FRK0_9BASI|nr:hypothetical protein E3P99_01154 [Wallemia hederae]